MAYWGFDKIEVERKEVGFYMLLPSPEEDVPGTRDSMKHALTTSHINSIDMHVSIYVRSPTLVDPIESWGYTRLLRQSRAGSVRCSLERGKKKNNL